MFSAPEILEKKGDVVSSHNESSDVYSFSLLALFILTGEVPFEGYSLAKIKQIIVEERSRPKLDSDLHQDLVQIIRACWQHDPGSRPSFNDINDSLTSISLA